MVFKKGDVPWIKGKKHSEETLQKMRAWSPSEETREKMRLAKKDFVPWNKGKIGIYSEEVIKKMSEARRGKKMSDETREKKRRYMRRHNHFKGKKHSLETRKKIKLARAGRIFPKKDTTIEIKTQNFLKKLGITFIPHKYISDIKYSYQCDIFIPVQSEVPNKTIVECDGDYWHGNLETHPLDKLSQRIKNQRCLDYERTAQLKEAGFTIVRLWENEINDMNENKFQERLLIA